MFDAPAHTRYDVTHGTSSYCCTWPETQASTVDMHAPGMDRADACCPWRAAIQVINMVASTNDAHIKMSHGFSWGVNCAPELLNVGNM